MKAPSGIKPFRKSLFVFRRDLRLADNTALLAAHQASQQVLHCFVFDPRQTEDNPYKSANALQFMITSLYELDQEVRQRGGKLYFFKGRAEEVVRDLVAHDGIEAVFVNADYTPFSVKRDLAIEEAAAGGGARFFCLHDALLNEPGRVLKQDGKPYTVFTPFFKAACRLPAAKPCVKRLADFYNGKTVVPALKDPAEFMPAQNQHVFVKGGRLEALGLVKRISKLGCYERERDMPALAGTTGLSAHLKFGTCSVREVYQAVRLKLDEGHPLIRQLYWRDFFTQIGFHFPHVFAGAYHRKYDQIVWENDQAKFKAWCGGCTGFPLVDAGMRQLNATGFMHNRVRMLAASFLVKDLHIDWRRGERYFANRLVDYDPAVNNGNWQWAASTGCDAQPYFRVFNPWLQQKKFDADCVYIKRWLPELESFPAAQIHRLENAPVSGYPEAIVDHGLAREEAEDLYRDVSP